MNLPDIRQLNIFIALEETRSFTTAAKQCFITQSAVSHSIKTLEKQLDFPLIERMGKKIILTPYGEVFLHHAKRVIKELETGISKLTTLKQWGYSSIHIGVPDSICQLILPTVLKEFSKEHPKCEISISIGDTAEILQQIRSGEMDLGVGLHVMPQDPKLVFTPLIEDNLCFITPKNHSWNEQNAIDRKNLSDVKLITYCEKSETRRLIKRHFNEHLIQYQHPLALGNMEAIKEITKLGMGVGIVPRWVAKKEIAEGSLIAHEISSPPPKRQWGIYSHSNRTFSLAEQHLIETCRTHLTEHIRQTDTNLAS